MASTTPKPTRLKVLHGNPGGRKPSRREPQPKPGIPEPPARVKANPVALSAWKELAAELDAMGVLTLADRPALAALVSAYCDWLAADEIVDSEGLTCERTTDRGGTSVVAHPAVAIRSDSWKRYKSMLVEFGLTPSARTRISTNPSPKKNRLAEFLESG